MRSRFWVELTTPEVEAYLAEGARRIDPYMEDTLAQRNQGWWSPGEESV